MRARALFAMLTAILSTLALVGIAAPAQAMSASTSNRVMDLAHSRYGASYAYGGTGPWRFDCSGFTQWVYRHAGRSLPRTSDAQASRGFRVSRANARPGDLAFFHNGGNVYHAAIYAGHGYVIHASRPGKPIGREKIWTSSVFFKRLR